MDFRSYLVVTINSSRPADHFGMPSTRNNDLRVKKLNG